MEKKLKSAGLDISSREAWQILKTVRVVEVGLGDDKTVRSVHTRKRPSGEYFENPGTEESRPGHSKNRGKGRIVTHPKSRSFLFNNLAAQPANMG